MIIPAQFESYAIDFYLLHDMRNKVNKQLIVKNMESCAVEVDKISKHTLLLAAKSYAHYFLCQNETCITWGAAFHLNRKHLLNSLTTMIHSLTAKALFNPFASKSDQYQIPPAASPET